MNGLKRKAQQHFNQLKKEKESSQFGTQSQSQTPKVRGGSLWEKADQVIQPKTTPSQSTGREEWQWKDLTPQEREEWEKAIDVFGTTTKAINNIYGTRRDLMNLTQKSRKQYQDKEKQKDEDSILTTAVAPLAQFNSFVTDSIPLAGVSAGIMGLENDMYYPKNIIDRVSEPLGSLKESGIDIAEDVFNLPQNAATESIKDSLDKMTDPLMPGGVSVLEPAVKIMKDATDAIGFSSPEDNSILKQSFEATGVEEQLKTHIKKKAYDYYNKQAKERMRSRQRWGVDQDDIFDPETMAWNISQGLTSIGLAALITGATRNPAAAGFSLGAIEGASDYRQFKQELQQANPNWSQEEIEKRAAKYSIAETMGTGALETAGFSILFKRLAGGKLANMAIRTGAETLEENIQESYQTGLKGIAGEWDYQTFKKRFLDTVKRTTVTMAPVAAISSGIIGGADLDLIIEKGAKDINKKTGVPMNQARNISEKFFSRSGIINQEFNNQLKLVKQKNEDNFQPVYHWSGQQGNKVPSDNIPNVGSGKYYSYNPEASQDFGGQRQDAFLDKSQIKVYDTTAYNNISQDPLYRKFVRQKNRGGRVKSWKSFKTKTPSNFNDSLQIIANKTKGEKADRLVEKIVDPDKLKYDGFQEGDFGKDTKSQDALEDVNTNNIKPLVVSIKDGQPVVIDGNHHLWAYKQRNINDVPVIVNEKEAGQITGRNEEMDFLTFVRNRGYNGVQFWDNNQQNKIVALNQSSVKKSELTAEQKNKKLQEARKEIDRILKQEERENIADINELLARDLPNVERAAEQKRREEEKTTSRTERKEAVQEERATTPADGVSRGDTTIRGGKLSGFYRSAPQYNNVSDFINDQQQFYTGKAGTQDIETQKQGVSLMPVEDVALNLVRPEVETGQQVSTQEVFLDPRANVLTTDRMPNYIRKSLEEQTQALRNISDRIDYETASPQQQEEYKKELKEVVDKLKQAQKQAKQYARKQKQQFDAIEFPRATGGMFIMNPKAVKTRQELERIWREANRPEGARGPRVYQETVDKSEQEREVEERNADIDSGDMAAKNEDEPMSMIKMVKMAKELTGGETPFIKNFPQALGKFYPDKQNPKIGLNPEIFKDSQQAAKTLAHEIGHLIDYLPEGEISGNLLGKLSAMKEFRKQILGDEKIIQQRKRVMNRINRYRRIAENQELSQEQQQRFDKALQELEKLDKKLNFEKDIKEELKSLTQYWKPFDDSLASPYFVNYRYSAPELYADFVSVLFNKPQYVQSLAPKTTRLFFEFLDNKPNVKAQYYADYTPHDLEVDLKKGFLSARTLFRKQREEKWLERHNLWHRLKNYFIDKNSTLIDKYREAVASGDIKKTQENLIYQVETYNMGSNWVEAMMEKFQTVRNKYLEKGISDDDFGLYLLYRRIQGDREDLGNPGGLTPQSAQKQIEVMKERLGEDGIKTLEEAAQKFRQVWIDHVLTPYYDAGMLTKEKYNEYLQEDQIYATFMNEKAILSGYISPSIIKQVGDLSTKQANPLFSTLLKGSAMLQAAHKNGIRMQVVDFLKDNFSNEIEKVSLRSKKPDNNIVYIKKNGKMEKYEVDPFIADIFKSKIDDKIGTLVAKTLGFVNTAWFRPVFVLYNLGFQGKNLIRDLMRTWKSTPTMSTYDIIKYYIKAQPTALRRAMGKKEKFMPEPLRQIFRKQDDLLREMKDNFALHMTYNDLIYMKTSDIDETDNEIEQIMSQYDLKTEEARERKRNAFKSIAHGFMGAIKGVGDHIESASKIAAYQYLKENTDMPMDKISHLVRTRAGTPDFKRRGTGYTTTNNLFLFSNIWKESLRATYDAAIRDPNTRSGWWTKTVMTNVVPKLFMLAAAHGLLGSDDEEKEFYRQIMNKTSEFYKTNYNVLPIGLTDAENEWEKQAVTLAIPTDETGRLVGALIWKLGTANMANKSFVSGLQDTLQFYAGDVPTWSPAVTMLKAPWDAIRGKNIQHPYFDKQILSEDEMKMGGWAKWKKVLKFEFNQSGLPMKFDMYDKISGEKVFSEKLSKIPVAGRFIKVTNYGEQELYKEKATQVNIPLKKEEKKEKEIISNYAEKYINKEMKLETAIRDSIKDYEQAVKDIEGGQKKLPESDREAMVQKMGKRIIGNRNIAPVEQLDASFEKEEKKNTVKLLVNDIYQSEAPSKYYDDAAEVYKITRATEMVSEQVWAEALQEIITNPTTPPKKKEIINRILQKVSP